MSLWKSLKESFLEEMSFDQNVEDIRGYEYFGTRLGCDLIILSVDCVHYMHVPASTFGSVQSLSQIQFFVTPWTAVCQTSVSITNSWSLLKLISIELVIHPTISSSVFPFSSCPQSFPASGSFQMSQLFASGGQSIGVSASASVLPMNIQDWFPLGWTWLDLLAVQGTLKSLLQHHSSEASVLQC